VSIVLEHEKGKQTWSEKMAQHPHPPPCFAKKRPESVENKGIGSAKEQQKTIKRPEDADDK
jgi:hypothetical protein